MKPDIVDILIVLIIASIVGYYIYLRYREEKKKKEEQLIPTLNYYKDKFSKEKVEYSEKARRFQEKVKKYKNKLKEIKENVFRYKWNDDEKQLLRRLKGTDFEWTFTELLKILDFQVYEPPVYKDHNIDLLLKINDSLICLDFVDYQQAKKINEKYIDTLIKGKDKYKCQGIWIISNGLFDQKIKNYMINKGVQFFEYKQVIKFFPSIRIVEDFYEIETKLNNYELLHKETADEVIRRDTWIKEVEEKLQEAYQKQQVEK
ncbi:restriction endonuclease [Persephonella sp. IF05-L8]|uniref:restriction endonuclease n=1 Tax=Persephonella sp. IF05-L8 TaxID=1158338 RepID=UPI0004956191